MQKRFWQGQPWALAALLFSTLFLLASAAAAEPKATPKATPTTYAVATFAGGCFWCMEPPYDKLPGVLSTTSGYMGGGAEDAEYKLVSAGKTTHLEVVQVVYDPAKVNYAQLLDVFWRNVDPLDGKGQFCDKGPHYLSAIFTHTPEQNLLAEASRQKLVESKRFAQPIVTAIRPALAFYPAEDYHQDYYQKNPLRYRYYRNGCGRDKRLKELWGD
jgi:peptide-methionine (S)-S-oxide reductase